MIAHTRADKLLPQLLMEQFDTLYTQCRHIVYICMNEFGRQKLLLTQCYENLDNFSVSYYKGVMLVLSWCMSRPINSYHSFSVIEQFDTFLHNVVTCNIYMNAYG